MMLSAYARSKRFNMRAMNQAFMVSPNDYGLPDCVRDQGMYFNSLEEIHQKDTLYVNL